MVSISDKCQDHLPEWRLIDCFFFGVHKEGNIDPRDKFFIKREIPIHRMYVDQPPSFLSTIRRVLFVGYKKTYILSKTRSLSFTPEIGHFPERVILFVMLYDNNCCSLCGWSHLYGFVDKYLVHHPILGAHV